MKSITKSLLNNGTIELLVRKNFEDVAAVAEIKELTAGMFNAVYSLCVRFSNGRPDKELVLKAAPYPTTKVTTIEKNIMKTEVWMYQTLPALGIPMPAVAACDFSRELIGCDYFFMEKLTGTPWNKAKLTAEDKARLKTDYGRILARVHTIKGDAFGDHKEKSGLRFDSWQEAVRCKMDNIIGDAKQGGLKLPYEEIAAALAPHWHLLDEIKTPSLVYCDLWAGNIFLTDKGGRWEIEGLIDPERSFWGDPLSDLLSAYAIYVDIKNEPEIQRGYTEVSGKPFALTRDDEIRMLVYGMHDSIFFAVETYRYNKVYAFFQLLYSKAGLRRQIKKLNSYMQ